MITSINLAKRLAITSNNIIIPITSFFDSDGDETDDWQEAVAFVAGSDNTGWFTELTSSYKSAGLLN